MWPFSLCFSLWFVLCLPFVWSCDDSAQSGAAQADAQAAMDAAQPTDQGQPGADQGRPTHDASIVQDATQPSEDATQPSEDATQPSEDATQPPEDATQPLEDAGEIEELTLEIRIEGEGKVRVEPSGEICEADCTLQLPAGSTVQLQPIAGEDQRFAGWGGSCAALEGETVQLTLQPDRRNRCDARFEWGPCREFVNLKETGRFELSGEAYAMQGVNFHFALGAQIANVDEPGVQPSDYQYDLFLAPYAYLPQFRDFCQISWMGGGEGDCCRDAESCRAHLVTQHIAHLKALGLNSVRVVGLGLDFSQDDAGVWRPVAPCNNVQHNFLEQETNAGRWRCAAPMDSPEQRQVLIERMVEAVNLLGEHGIRSVLLTGGHHHFYPGAREIYQTYLSELAEAFKNNPFLIAYDPMNEPTYAYNPRADDPFIVSRCGAGVEVGRCKEATSDITRQWFEALTSVDSNHLVTVGQGNTYTKAWDPLVIWDHFTSWHIYPQPPWAHPTMPGRTQLRDEIYRAGLLACGRECPHGGEFDGAHCRHTATPFGAEHPFLWEGGLYYDYMDGQPGNCPKGWDDGAHCQLGNFVPGRDQMQMLPESSMYVEAQGGACPEGAQLQGALCFLGEGPLGARVQIVSPAGRPPSFGYSYPSGQASRCFEGHPPFAGFCVIGEVPQGWTPALKHRTWFVTPPELCEHRRPTFLGEVGFSVYPNGQNLEAADNSQNSYLQRKRNDCLEMDERSQPHGSEQEQVEFLAGGVDPIWRGLFEEARDCDIQGLHWWLFSSVHWGLCASDHFGLYCHWEADGSTEAPNGDPRTLVERPAVAQFRAMDFTSPAGACEEPAGYTARSRDRYPTNTITRGKVVDDQNRPIPYASIHSWSSTWDKNAFATTDAQGNFELHTQGCPPRIDVTHWGYELKVHTGIACSGGLANLGVVKLNVHAKRLNWRTQLLPPQDRRTACLIEGDWQMREPGAQDALR